MYLRYAVAKLIYTPIWKRLFYGVILILGLVMFIRVGTDVFNAFWRMAYNEGRADAERRCWLAHGKRLHAEDSLMRKKYHLGGSMQVASPFTGMVPDGPKP